MLYFLAGGVAGAAVGLFLALQSDKVTRETMGRRLQDNTDSTRGLKDRVVRRGEVVWEKAVHRVDEAASALAGNGPRKVRGK